jgi:hypothetical protein
MKYLEMNDKMLERRVKETNIWRVKLLTDLAEVLEEALLAPQP